ncbi:MAG: anaerobic ribonucleoside-triphosphate reductase activating protein [Nanoarchaeota archaeon]|nr:anaerobic ribonucleoside-triphosphate reductase activating protein [Nanoarchaeota archaeon]
MVLIKGIHKTSIVDYPTKVACTIFTAGCNFRCPFCHNPDLIEKKGHDKLDTIEEKKFFDFLDKRKKWLDGVVITGGEPCINKDLPEFVRKIKEKGFLVKIDTNGTNPSMLKSLVGQKLVDYIAMDIKADEENYSKAVGITVDIDNIKKSIDIIKRSGVNYEFRTTIVPTLHDKKSIERMGMMIEGTKKIVLQQFNNKKTYDPGFEEIKPYSKEEIVEFAKILEHYTEKVEIRD